MKKKGGTLPEEESRSRKLVLQKEEVRTFQNYKKFCIARAHGERGHKV